MATPDPDSQNNNRSHVLRLPGGVEISLGFAVGLIRTVNKYWQVPLLLTALCLGVFNLLESHQGRGESRIVAPGAEQPIQFSKTFLFWIPKFDTDTTTIDAVTAEKEFHERLNYLVGGWTRWSVRGSDSTEEEDGYLYLISLPADKDVKPEQIQNLVKEFFVQTTFYVVRFNH